MSGPDGGDPLRGRKAPLALDPEEFARVGHELVDRIAELFRSLPDRPLTSGETPEQIRALLGADQPLPEHGTEAGPLLEEAAELLIEHSLYNSHPRFFGYITAPPGPVGVLGELLAAAVNPNVGGWSLSPMASEIEGQTVRWIADLLGFPQPCGGILVSGGNMANMLGFFAARAARAGWDVRRTGVCGEAGGKSDGSGKAGASSAKPVGSGKLRVYASVETHTWIQKAADLSGLGIDAVRWIPTDEHQCMDVTALRSEVQEDVLAGHRPFLVVGTAGSVSTGAVDPLPRLRRLCDEMELWLHVDGAYGGFAVAAEDRVPKDLLGLRLADSLAVDPHKWLYAPLEVGCTLVRDPAALAAAFSYRPDYYNFQDEATNYFEHGIQNSRSFRALKVWLQLRHVGREGYARAIGEDMELARRFHQIATEHPELEAVTQGLSITTYRYVPPDLARRADREDVAAYLDELNEAVHNRMEKCGRAFVSNAVVEGRYLLRMCVVNFRTRLEDVEELAEVTAELGREADAELRPEHLR